MKVIMSTLVLLVALVSLPSVLQGQTCRYYAFEYYYPTVKLTYKIGEVSVHHQNGAIDTLNLQNFGYLETFCGETLQNLIDSSETSSFTMQAGDQLSYFSDLLLHFSDVESGVNVPDTLLFIPELYDISTGSTLLALDSSGLYPVNDIDDVPSAFAKLDTSIIDFRSLPSAAVGKQLAVRIRIYFSGPDSLAAVCRKHVGYLSPLSFQAVSDRIYFDNLIDSLIAEGIIDTSGFSKPRTYRQAADDKDFRAYRVIASPNPAVDNTTIRIERADRQRPSSSAYALLLDVTGRQVATWSVPPDAQISISTASLSPGGYYLVPVVDGRFHIGTQLLIVR